MMKRVLFPVLVAAIAMGARSVALAHAFLHDATPKVGAVVMIAPKTIRIRFTEPVEPTFSHIELFAADGKAIDMGPVATDPSDRTQLTAPVTGTLAPGQYQVKWDVLSVDAHRTNGHFAFTYRP